MPRRRALVTGVSGQDGSYLARLLQSRDVDVVGISRTPPAFELAEHHSLDLAAEGAVEGAIAGIVRQVRPDECYHLAAHHRSSHAVATKSALSDAAEEAHYLRANLLVTHTLLAALREHAPACRTFLAGSCHMFGDTKQRPQTEDTPFAPNSLYGLTKVASAQLGRIYREKHRMFVGTGILYNHESPLRRTDFVSAKIAKGAVDVLRGTRHEIDLADVETEVDWGFAGEYAAAMIAMTGAQVAEDFIIASGTVHRVKDFARLAFERVGLDWTKHVRQASPGDRSVARTVYQGDISRIRERLGWSPKTTFAQLVAMMVDHHLAQNPA